MDMFVRRGSVEWRDFETLAPEPMEAGHKEAGARASALAIGLERPGDRVDTLWVWCYIPLRCEADAPLGIDSTCRRAVLVEGLGLRRGGLPRSGLLCGRPDGRARALARV